MEKIIDYAPTFLGLFLAFIGVRKAVLEGWRNIALIELIIGILLCAVNLISISSSSAKSERLQNGISVLIKNRETDSTDNANFRKYLKDTFGIEKRGDSAFIVNKAQYLTFIKQPTSTEYLPDSLNFNYRISKDTFFFSPKKGGWAKAIVLYDTSLKPNFDMGMSNGSTRDIVIDGKTYTTKYNIAFSEVASMDEPFRLMVDISTIKFLVFGDDVDRNKRYLYKNGKVRWFPEK